MAIDSGGGGRGGEEGMCCAVGGGSKGGASGYGQEKRDFLPAKPAVRCIVRLSGTHGSFGLMVECDPFGYEGFISIDCGTVEGSTNNDATTNINNHSDGSSVDMGMHVNICSNLMLQTLPQRLLNVKSFPEGDGNCYALVPEQGKGNKYLIRASFVYGNK